MMPKRRIRTFRQKKRKRSIEVRIARQLKKDAVVNYKTTLGGVVAFVAVLSKQLETLFDEDAATNPDYILIIAAASVLMAALFARDADKSTEDSR